MGLIINAKPRLRYLRRNSGTDFIGGVQDPMSVLMVRKISFNRRFDPRLPKTVASRYTH
jgi:hypothetical protein